MANDNHVLNIVGFLTPLCITPTIALVGTVTLGAVLMKEHGTGSLLIPTGILIFTLIGHLHNQIFLSVFITLLGFAGVFLRGAILQAELSGNSRPISTFVVGSIIVVYAAFAYAHISHIVKGIKSNDKKSKDKSSIEAFSETGRDVFVPWNEGT